MKQGNLSLKVVYRPLNTYKNIVVINGSNRQNYNANTRYFEPDRRIDPYVVRVECGVNDPHNLVNGLVNDKLTDVVWKISDAGVFKIIESTNKDFVIGTGADKGQLKVFKNVSDLEAVTIVFTARYMEQKTKRVVNYQESFTLITLPIATSPIVLETAAPVGYNLIPTENNQGLLCTANLVQGIEKLPAAYWWYKGDTLLTDANGYQGTATKKLFIPAEELSKAGDVFKCEVADCTEQFNDLVQQKVDADADVIEWRRLYQSESENLSNSFYDWFSISMDYVISNFGRQIEIMPIDFRNDSAIVSKNITRIGTGYISFYVECIESCVIYVDGRSEIIESNHLDKLINGIYFTLHAGFKGVIVNKYVFNSINENWYIGIQNDTSKKKVIIENPKLWIGDNLSEWSPSKQDLQNLISQKTEYYKQETTLPEGYRPQKPAKLYKGDYMLMKQMPVYNVEVLYPKEVSPESESVQAEMVLNTNQGIIKEPEKLFSVGWIKQSDGTFKYKGFKVNIAIADIIALNEENKELDYELREDLTLKV
ncbi:MAG: hypothetical protein LBE34_13935 [Flavobacteriaceae bacterium]|jgi:hypothetical protein|nr:hypothetical protein [Flavobacteriaceae bacterium]